MTVTANTTRNQYSAGNQQNTYAYTFQIHDASDLKVYIGDELKSLNTHYTVTGVGSGTGGNVVFDLGVDGNGDPIYIPENTVVSIFLAMDLDRDTNYQPSGAFLAADVNNDFDRLWIASNQQQTDINRSVRLQDTDADASMVLPKIADRANKLLAFSSVLSGATPVTINNNYAQWNSAYDNMITGMQLPSNGILRLSQQDGSDYTVDLDSRYHNIGIDIPDADISESSVTQHRTAMLDIPNNVKAKFGNGDELEIYSDGYTSVIKESGNGNLAILGDYLFLGNPDGTENYFTAQDGVGVGLYHNGTLKVSTSGDGISVSGTIQATGYNDTNWDTAYSWGDHSTAGYLTSFDITTQTDPKYLRADENDTTTGTLTAAGLIAGGLTYPTSDGSSNQVLVTDGNGTLSFANQSGGNGSSQWTTSGSDIYYNTGNVGIGTSSPTTNYTKTLHIHGSGTGASLHLTDPTSGATASDGLEVFQYGNDGYIWEREAGHLRFGTSATERMRIDSSGNVGIGTTSPAATLHVDASAPEFRLSQSGTAKVRFRTTGDNYINTGQNLGIGTASPSRNLSVNGTFGVGNGTIETIISFSDRGIFGTQSNHDLELRTNGSEAMRITSSGNVGIGTSNPLRELEVTGTGNVYARITAPTDNDSAALELKNTQETWQIRNEDTNDDALEFIDDTATRLTIKKDGNVGIGTTSPNQLLSLNSTASTARGISIDQSGAERVKLLYTNSSGSFDINNTTAGYTSFSNNGSERMRIDSSGNVGIGTSSPSAMLDVELAATGTIAEFRGGDSDILQIKNENDLIVFDTRNTANGLAFQMQGAERMRMDASGNVGIGTAIPSTFNTSNGAGNLVVGSGSGAEGITVYSGTTSNGALCFADGTSSTDTYKGYVQYNHNTNSMQFATGHTEKMRIDSSGNLLVGKTNTTLGTVGIENRPDGRFTSTRSGNTNLTLNRLVSDGSIIDFYKDGSTVGSIGSRAGLVTYITSGGTYSGLDFGTDINPMKSGALSDGQVNLGASGQRFLNLHLSGNVHTGDGTAASPAYTFGDDTDTGIFSPAADTIAFSEGGTEAMRISSSGNVGIGKTDPLRKIDMAYAKTADDTIGLRINNTATTYDGKVISVCKGASSAEQGVIGYADGFGLQSFYIAAGVAGLRCQTEFGSSPRLSPCNSSGTLRDNTTDLGASNARFDDIYATNTSIISTSDSTLKQDVETLTDAEERVAIACKGLLRKFRWRDAVAEKGDEARIHFGIMAQDLRDAFTAEGLDAHKYGMFCSNTWWEHEDEYYPTADSAPEGATEVTRMGVRYSELLAFIISAI